MIQYAFKPDSFWSLIRRTRFIKRWSLMFNLSEENVSEHSHEVSIFSHAIAVIGVCSFNKTYSPERIATIGIYHEASESIIGDLASTLKHANKDTSAFFKNIEDNVTQSMLNTLPKKYSEYMSKLTLSDYFSDEEKDIVKAADLFSMLVKCEHELSLGNKEFIDAKEKITNNLTPYFHKYPEVVEFSNIYLQRCNMTIDGLVTL